MFDDNGAFRALVKDAAATLTIDSIAGVDFASDGDLVWNDWKENPDGENYRQRISAAGSPDLLGWARTVLAPRVQAVFEEFSARYGWGDPGQIRFSRRGTEAAAGPARDEVTDRASPRRAADTNTDRDITIQVPVEGGKTATLTVNAKTMLDQLAARQRALEMVKECLA